MTELHDLTAIEQLSALRTGEIGPVDLTRHYLDRGSTVGWARSSR